ncbi:hypothetical protein ElyMa_002927500 [Elysia marginata]|uniref:Uncharacterized protein n=1 Tax=Elysia marginata TaxID=1093978 RepID=A0AAV4I7G1_9GAST|nr:hypothetical protein ElyMa_002927500 [Elysia marginata]
MPSAGKTPLFQSDMSARPGGCLKISLHEVALKDILVLGRSSSKFSWDSAKVQATPSNWGNETDKEWCCCLIRLLSAVQALAAVVEVVVVMVVAVVKRVTGREMVFYIEVFSILGSKRPLSFPRVLIL